jgi:hypothetical protein
VAKREQGEITRSKTKSLIRSVLGIGLAFLFLGTSSYVCGQEAVGGPVNLDVILLIDNSTGMSEVDPEELRIRAEKFLVDYLRVNADASGANHRVGVASFGGTVGDVIPLRLLQDNVVRDGIHAEEIELIDFRGPLQFAFREFRAKSLGAGNEMAIILLTGGRPQLTDIPMTSQELRAYFEELAPLVGELQEEGISLFVLGIGDAQRDRDDWTQLIPGDHYISITSAELADVYHRIVADLIGAAVSIRGNSVPSGREVSIEVEPYLELVVISFIKSDPAIQVTLIPPTGTALVPTVGMTDVHHSIYSVINPSAGEWEALWEGEGQVRYWLEKQFPLVRVDSIESSCVGQPVTITASLVRNNVPVIDPELCLEAEITLPGGEVVTQTLSSIGKGVYTVTAKATLGELSLFARPMAVKVSLLPIPPTLTSQPTSTSTPEMATATPAVTLIPSPTPTPASTSEWGPVGISVVLALLMVSLGVASWHVYSGRKKGEEPREKSPTEALDGIKKATHLGQIEEIMWPIEQDAQTAKQYPPSLFAMKILRHYAIEDIKHAERELKRYARSEISAEKQGAGIAVFNLLVRGKSHQILPQLYTFVGWGCDSGILQYAQAADVEDVPDLREANRQQVFNVRTLCKIYSDLLGDEVHSPRLEAEVEEILEHYRAKDVLALHRCIRDSRDLRKGQDVIPIDVSPQLRESSFASISQLRPLRDILVQFDGVELFPLYAKAQGGFLDVLEQARQQLNELKEEERLLPEWRMAAHLLESWRNFIGEESDDGKARLVAKPVTQWLPRNVKLDDVHVAWVLCNEGASFVEVGPITLCLGEWELGRDTSANEMLLGGEQKLVAFPLSKLEGSGLPTDLDLTLVISLENMWERDTIQVCCPHRSFEVPKIYLGRVIGEEVVGLLRPNRSPTADDLRRYCLEAQLYVHCNQLALLQLLEYSGGYPLFAHILLDGLIRYLKDANKWQEDQPRYVTCADVPKVVQYVVDRDLASFAEPVARAWSTFPLDERNVIEALLESVQAQGGELASLTQIQMCLGSDEPIDPVLDRLKTKGILETKDRRYRLRARLIEEWLRARQERAESMQER